MTSKSTPDSTILQHCKRWLEVPKKSFAAGRWQKNSSARQFTLVNPASAEPLLSYEVANAADVDVAVKAARQAHQQRLWSGLERQKRQSILKSLSQLIRDNARELALLETWCNGKLYKESLYDDVPESADVFDYYAGWIDKHYGETCPVAADFLNYTVHEPVGVCGLIVPWNFPLLLACWKLAPALAMGNCVVIKPSEHTPLTLLRLFELIDEAKLFAPGVVNLVIGDAETGKALSESAQVDKISFTGSTEVGRLILGASAKSNLKRVTLELGGKSPNIIFADAPDLKAAIDRSVTAIFSHKGEKCSEPTRLLVEKSVYKKVLDGLKLEAARYICGDPLDADATQGAQCYRAHYESILNYLEIAKSEGLKVLCGGHAEKPKAAPSGLFIAPTIYYDVPATSRLFQEEIFGPVLVVTPFSDEAEAVFLANDTSYGLAAGFWTADASRAHRVARQLEAGMVFVNRYGCYDFSSPFGGIKQSGWGKEMAVHSLNEYTQTKSIWLKI